MQSMTFLVSQPSIFCLVLLTQRGNRLIMVKRQISQIEKNDHVQKKDFWNIALIFISDNPKIYGDDVKYLEYLGIEAAQNAGSYELLNGANPRKPNIAPFRINDMEVFFRDIQLLSKFYGCG